VNIVSSKKKDLFFPNLQLQKYNKAVLKVHFVSRLIFKIYNIVSETLIFYSLSHGRESTSYYVYWNSDSKIHILQYEKILEIVRIAIQFTRLIYRQPLSDFP